MEISRVSTPKEFFIKERDSFYSSWTLSFWREFFQNSVDAKAKNINIEITSERGRGDFDKIGNAEKNITRIVFSDDGIGMNEDILNKVYFAIGQTTKNDGSSVGGYGRARLMTCFSQDRYSILTKDRFVMGNGPDYVNFSLDEAEVEITKALEEMKNSPEAQQEDITNFSVSYKNLTEDLNLVKEAKAKGGYNGCRVEVDLDQNTGNYYDHPTVEVMKNKLEEYLSESQIKPNVSINGNSPETYYNSENKIQARKGQSKRSLFADIDGQETAFATVHISDNDKALHKGKAIIRVDGASMYTLRLDTNAQVIIEIDQKYSRLALTSNRDGMKDVFNRALNHFISELNIDNRTALAEKKGKDNYKINGDKGMMKALMPVLSNITNDQILFEEIKTAETIINKKTPSISTLEDLLNKGVSEDMIDELIKQTYWGNSILSNLRYNHDFSLSEDLIKFIDNINTYIPKNMKQHDIFFDYASEPLKNWIVQTLGTRHETALEKIKEENQERLRDMNDVYVSVISSNEKTRAAIRRNDPRKWDVENGKGRVPRALLTSWTAACSVAVETLMEIRPALSNFIWTTGWVYAIPEETYQGDRNRNVSIQALCSREGEDNEFKFLLNPIKEDGVLKYSLTDPNDRQKLQALAMHEVAHVIETYHNESYATVLTEMMMSYDFNESNKRMRDSIKAVLSAYERGKSIVQPLDNEPGPRPAQRLMALATANNPEAASDAITYNPNGTYQVDNDRLQDHVNNNEDTFENNQAMQYGV